MSSSFKLFLLAAAVLAAGGAASTAQGGSKFGSGAIITSRPCSQPADQTCVVAGVPRTFTQVAGGYGVGLTTLANISAGEMGQAEVTFGDGYLPSIRVGSSAGAATRTGASATAFRSYTYTGDVAIDLALGGALHYVTSGDAPGEADGDGQLNVAFGVLRLSDIAQFNPGSTGNDIISSVPTSFADCDSGAVAAGGYTSLGTSGENTVRISLDRGCDGAALTLHKGDTFVIFATLQAISNRGGFLDAMHTFNVEFDDEHTYVAGTTERADPSALQAVNGAAPEPAAWALMLIGFTGAGAALRRRRTLA